MSAIDRHAAKIRAAVESGDAARSALVASWRRCTYSYGLDPANEKPQLVLSEAELKASVERMEPLLISAKPALERMHRSFDSRGVCILFADQDGVPVRWYGSQSDAKELRQWGLRPGIDWSEHAAGTNGIGTCLVERSPLIVHREQHFYMRDVGISCAVAPVFDHLGMLAGALDVTIYGTTNLSKLTGIILAAVIDAARQIEIDHFHNVFHSARIVSIPTQSRSGAALVAVDADDIVLGATRAARRDFNLTDAQLHDGVCIQGLLGGNEDSFSSAERATVRRALVRHGGNVSRAAKYLHISRATMKRKLKQHGIKRKLS